MSGSLLIFVVAIPIFVISIIVEFWLAYRAQRALYNTADTLTNLQLGTGQLLVGLITKAPLLALYHLVYLWGQGVGIPSWDVSSWPLWVLGFLVMDCAYYWFHRLSHEVNFLWAAHAVHHQSEYYNLSVALRQSWIQQVYSGIFYIPLALLGIPVEMFFTLNALNTLSQFWIHTELLGKLGTFELWLNTPSHHRVHHGTDDEYVDRNYAGALIIWDRLVGSFIEEDQTPRYGVIKPLRSWNPLWANLDVWSQMTARMRRSPDEGGLGFSRALTLPFRAPAWRGEGESAPDITLRTDASYERFNGRGLLYRYGFIMGAIDIGLGSYWTAAAPQYSVVEIAAGVGLILMSATVHSACVEGRSWAWIGALTRLLAGFALYALVMSSSPNDAASIWA